MNKKIQSFTDLVSWQQCHSLVLKVYKLTKHFPQEEKYCLVNQMRRAAVSITSNIAEGFSRKSNKDKQKFYFISLGSLTELQNQLIIARDLGYIENKEYIEISETTLQSSKLISGLISSASRMSAY